jgi:hypothetical protein
MDKLLSNQEVQALLASGAPMVEVIGVTRKSKFAGFAALKAASKDNQGYADFFESPVQTSDQNLMFDATELPIEAKAVVVDYLVNQMEAEEDSQNCVLCGFALENVNDIDGLCNACITKTSF